jgi:hypothetical protein
MLKWRGNGRNFAEADRLPIFARRRSIENSSLVEENADEVVQKKKKSKKNNKH